MKTGRLKPLSLPKNEPPKLFKVYIAFGNDPVPILAAR